MPRAVQTLGGSLIHLYPDGASKTKCGLISGRNAPQIIHRRLMCMNCFGRNHGVNEWTASKLGIEQIYETRYEYPPA